MSTSHSVFLHQLTNFSQWCIHKTNLSKKSLIWSFATTAPNAKHAAKSDKCRNFASGFLWISRPQCLSKCHIWQTQRWPQFWHWRSTLVEWIKHIAEKNKEHIRVRLVPLPTWFSSVALLFHPIQTKKTVLWTE